MIVVQPSGTGEARLLAESAPELAEPGKTTFATRIPVSAGALIGLSGRNAMGAMTCPGTPDADAGLIYDPPSEPVPVGATRPFFAVEPNIGVPVVATVEPDKDADGYGDETQDGCPGSTNYTGPCPVVSLSTKSELKRKAILVTVRSTAVAPVQVFGFVIWRIRQTGSKGKEIKLTQLLSAGAERTVAPGAPMRFRVPLEKTILRRLGRIEPSQHLTANLTARATDFAGHLPQRHFKVRLPGRG